MNLRASFSVVGSKATQLLRYLLVHTTSTDVKTFLFCSALKFLEESRTSTEVRTFFFNLVRYALKFFRGK